VSSEKRPSRKNSRPCDPGEIQFTDSSNDFTRIRLSRELPALPLLDWFTPAPILVPFAADCTNQS
jgi:hypothetical protein